MAANKVNLQTKITYGFGQLAEGVKNTAFGTFLLLYYNQVLGLSGTLAGVAIFIALCFDAVTDPIAGSISDNFKSKWGRRHPFMYASAIPLAVAFYFLFAPPADLSSFALFIWMALSKSFLHSNPIFLMRTFRCQLLSTMNSAVTFDADC